MKKPAILLLILGVCPVLNAGTMLISGLPSLVDTSAGQATLTFDITSNGQLANDHLYVWTYAQATLDIAGATNNVIAGAIYDNSSRQWLEDDYGIDISNVTLPIIWGDIAIPGPSPRMIVGNIIRDLGLTIPAGFAGTIDVKVLSENSASVEDTFTIEAIPEPTTIAVLALGALCLRRRK
ncbi:MAG TPA: PEP-CTERM sorting domain-containing protein [Sedimentisphaerales bacterium]|nr:PEP-CTERM sorting domain-containing protein [Sedimentisphaerales bacterium]